MDLDIGNFLYTSLQHDSENLHIGASAPTASHWAPETLPLRITSSYTTTDLTTSGGHMLEGYITSHSLDPTPRFTFSDMGTGALVGMRL